LHEIIISVPVQARMPSVVEHVTGWTRCTVPSGHREKPEAAPSLVGSGTAPGHGPVEIVVLPPEPVEPVCSTTFAEHEVRPMAARSEARSERSEGVCIRRIPPLEAYSTRRRAPVGIEAYRDGATTGFAVRVQSDDPAVAQEILRRAQGLVAR
jgi:hypothetical protein